jgi:hypothetical protein
MGIVREPRVRGTSAIESRYQTTTGEDNADLKRLSVFCSERQSVLISNTAIDREMK